MKVLLAKDRIDLLYQLRNLLHQDLYHRKNLRSGSCLEGPALIVDSTSSIVLEAGWTAKVESNGSLLLAIHNSNRKPLERLNKINIEK